MCWRHLFLARDAAAPMLATMDSAIKDTQAKAEQEREGDEGRERKIEREREGR